MEEMMHRRVIQYGKEPVSAVLADFHTCPDGYTEAEVTAQREQYGANRTLAYGVRNSFLYRLGRAFLNPFTLTLGVLAVVSYMADEILSGTVGRTGTMAVVLAVMLAISGIIRFVQEMRAKRIVDHLANLIATTATVRRDGVWKEIPITEVVVGDTVRFHAGNTIPADLRLTESQALFVSEAALTGESAAVSKRSESCRLAASIALQGSVVVGGWGQGIVLAVGRDTAYGELAAVPHEKYRGFDRGARAIAWVFVRFMAVLVPIVFIACGLTQGNWLVSFLFALSVAIGLIPELLPLVSMACLAKGSMTMERHETIVRSVNAMQALGSLDVLCIDKTGTLTGDTVQLEYYLDIFGNESEQVLTYAYLNSLYHSGMANHLDQAILKYKQLPGKETYFAALPTKFPKLGEIPFDYERKCVSVLVAGETEDLLLVKGNIEALCQRCTSADYRGQIVPFQPTDMTNVHAVVDDMLDDGMKGLAVAYKRVPKGMACTTDLEQGLTLIGYLAFFDAPKHSAASAIAKLQELHVPVKVLTGDQEAVAISICRRLGLDTTAMTGADIERLSPEALASRVEKTTIFAELAPPQKARLVQVLQDAGHTVGFLGDGMNDLPAMLTADVGISVHNAVEAVQQVAGVILLQKDLNVLAKGILEGRKAFCNMTKYIKATASSNFGNIFSIVIASVLLLFLPMASIQLLLLNLLYDGLCLVLPWDTVDAEVYAKPRPWTGRYLGRFMRFFGPISSVFDLLTFVFLYFVLCPAQAGASFEALLPGTQQEYFISLFQTGWFLESLWTQILILHFLRTPRIPFLQSRPAIPVLVVTLCGIAAFTILTFTSVGTALGLTMLPTYYFIFLIAIVIAYMVTISLAKRYYMQTYGPLL